jgi:hypothetical protein
MKFSNIKIHGVAATIQGYSPFTTLLVESFSEPLQTGDEREKV